MIALALFAAAFLFWLWSHAAKAQIHATARFVVACVLLSWAVTAGVVLMVVS